MGVGLALVTVCAGCRVSPLTNRIAVGEVPYLVMVGEGPDGQTDLFAVESSGGEVVRFTFSRAAEFHPVLGPGGELVAFIRQSAGNRPWLAVMNLLSSAEREVALPESMGTPTAVGWSRDGSRIFVASAAGAWSTPAPPAVLELEPVAGTEAIAEADSALQVLLGEPAFATAFPCPEGAGICSGTGSARTVIVPDGREPFRWGPDSVGYLQRGRLEVRPLGAGRARRLDLIRPPAGLRQPSFFPGPPVG